MRAIEPSLLHGSQVAGSIESIDAAGEQPHIVRKPRVFERFCSGPAGTEGHPELIDRLAAGSFEAGAHHGDWFTCGAHDD
jgi:hypothetical protein